MAQSNIHGHLVTYDSSAEYGAHYLRNLGDDAAAKIFNSAVSSPANFTDDSGHGYKLSYVGDGYKLSKKY